VRVTHVLAGLVIAAASVGSVVFWARGFYFVWIAKRGARPSRARDLIRRPSWDDYDPQLAFQAYRKFWQSILGFLACTALIVVVSKLFFP
jgi:hypothetical protein